MSKTNITHIVPIPVQREFTALGERIRVRRKTNKWTLQSLAERCNCSVPTLRALEQGKGTVSISVLMNVLWCLGQYKSVSEVCKEVVINNSKPVDDSWKDI